MNVIMSHNMDLSVRAKQSVIAKSSLNLKQIASLRRTQTQPFSSQ